MKYLTNQTKAIYLYPQELFFKMVKPICEMIFQKCGEEWRRVDSQEPNPPTLAEMLLHYNIIVDDRTQFARIYDYDINICFYYRVYGAKITLTLWRIGNVT